MRYGAIDAGLAKVAAQAHALGASLHLPRIGCGLAGGDRATVESIVARTPGGLDVTDDDFAAT